MAAAIGGADTGETAGRQQTCSSLGFEDYADGFEDDPLSASCGATLLPRGGIATPEEPFPDQANWEAHTRSHLSTARSLREETQSKLLSNTLKGPHHNQSSLLTQTLRKRVATSTNLSKALLSRIETTQQLIQKVSQCTLALQRDYESKRVPLAIVKKRLALREQRPVRERLQDHFQIALERELHTLEGLQQQLAEHLRAGNTMHSSLEGAKAELVKDVQCKRHALRLERSSLLFDAFHGKDRACALPPVSKMPESSIDFASDRPTTPNRLAVGFVQELLAKTRRLEECATLFCKEADVVLQRSRRDTEKARNRTTTSMKARIAETLQLKKQLQKEAADSQSAITRTELSLDMMQQETSRQQEILSGMDPDREVPLSSFDQRLPPPIIERMRDDAMARQKDTYDRIASNVNSLEEKSWSVRQTLEQLRATHARMLTNLELKTAAWNIDLACSKVQAPPSGALAAIGGGGDAATAEGSPPPPPTAAAPPPAPQQPPPGGPTPRRRLVPLDGAMINVLRGRIKAASYTGKGRELDVIFSKFDKDGSGQLDEGEVRLALRRSLKIPPHVISDEQVAALCAMLDADHSGSVSIAEIVAFVGNDQDEMFSQRTGRPLLKLAPLNLEEAESAAASQSKSQLSLSVRSAPTPRRPRGPPLRPEVLEGLRSKIKAASYSGHLGRELEALLGRFDKDGSGQLDDEEIRQALRRTLRIPPTVISDAEISSLCAMLDADNSGAVSIAEIVDFIGHEEVSKRTGKALRASVSVQLDAAVD